MIQKLSFRVFLLSFVFIMQMLVYQPVQASGSAFSLPDKTAPAFGVQKRAKAKASQNMQKTKSKKAIMAPKAAKGHVLGSILDIIMGLALASAPVLVIVGANAALFWLWLAGISIWGIANIAFVIIMMRMLKTNTGPSNFTGLVAVLGLILDALVGAIWLIVGLINALPLLWLAGLGSLVLALLFMVLSTFIAQPVPSRSVAAKKDKSLD